MSFIYKIIPLLKISSLIGISSISYNQQTKLFESIRLNQLKCILIVILIAALDIFIFIMTIQRGGEEFRSGSRVTDILTALTWLISTFLIFYLSINFVRKEKNCIRAFNKIINLERCMTKSCVKSINYKILKWNFILDSSIMAIDFIWFSGKIYIYDSPMNIFHFLKCVTYFIQKYYRITEHLILESIVLIIYLIIKNLRMEYTVIKYRQVYYMLELEMDIQEFITVLSRIMSSEIIPICGLFFTVVTRIFYLLFLDIEKYKSILLWLMLPLFSDFKFILWCHICGKEVVFFS